MLERPDLDEAGLAAWAWAEYGIAVSAAVFLPLGADPNTAAYRAVAADGSAYFLKLRRGPFDEMSAALPHALAAAGLPHLIPPLPTLAGRLWAAFGAFTVIAYPFVDGQDAYTAALTDAHWRALGAALQRLHAFQPPEALARRLQAETFAPHWRAKVRVYLARLERETWTEPAAAQTAALLRAQRPDVLDLLARTEALAQDLIRRPRPLVVCHTDLHAGNLFIGPQAELYIVDWDSPLRAPKERDLMYVGGGQMAGGRTPEAEEALFYPAYGPAAVDRTALAYYRYERIIEDIAAFCDQLLGGEAGGADRAQAYRYLASNFEPGCALDLARAAEAARRPWLPGGA